MGTHQAGSIRELFFRADEPAAVLALECGDVDEARRVLASLPMVAAGLIDFESIPLRAYPGFGRLSRLARARSAGSDHGGGAGDVAGDPIGSSQERLSARSGVAPPRS